MRKPARRRLYPMPIAESLIDSAAFTAMPAAGAGIVLRLLLHFWQTDCRPLPTADHELRAISRAHIATWTRWKGEALGVFESMRPELERYRAQRDANRESLRIVSWRGANTTQARAAKTALQPPDSPALATIARPITEAAHGPPSSPQSPSQARRFAQRTR